jgi:hypothetical protein
MLYRAYEREYECVKFYKNQKIMKNTFFLEIFEVLLLTIFLEIYMHSIENMNIYLVMPRK